MRIGPKENSLQVSGRIEMALFDLDERLWALLSSSVRVAYLVAAAVDWELTQWPAPGGTPQVPSLSLQNNPPR